MLKIAVFWVVALCGLVEVYQRFTGPCCLHHQGAATQETAIFILAAVETSDPTDFILSIMSIIYYVPMGCASYLIFRMCPGPSPSLL
jgi:hypothetical protein